MAKIREMALLSRVVPRNQVDGVTTCQKGKQVVDQLSSRMGNPAERKKWRDEQDLQFRIRLINAEGRLRGSRVYRIPL